MNATFSVKNFERFQHYKDRSPPWIKLYNELLEDYGFGQLRDSQKGQLICIWLLASRMDNKLPYDPKWIANKINAQSPVDLDGLAAAGFIVPFDAAEAKGKREDWPSRYIPDEVREAVLARDKRACRQCGVTEALEIDHVKPISKGGTGDPSNLQVLCRSCNRKKRALLSYADAEQVATQMPSQPEQMRSLEREGETEQSRGETEKSVAPAADLVGAAFEAFKAVATECSLPIPTKLTADRRRHLAARLAEHGPEGWQRALDKLAASGFCRGDGERRWKADLDFVLQPKSFNRLLDGGYDNHGTPADDLLQQVRAGLAESTDDQPNGHGNHQALHSDPDREDVGAAPPPRLEHSGSGLDRDVLPDPGRPRPH